MDCARSGVEIVHSCYCFSRAPDLQAIFWGRDGALRRPRISSWRSHARTPQRGGPTYACKQSSGVGTARCAVRESSGAGTARCAVRESRVGGSHARTPQRGVPTYAAAWECACSRAAAFVASRLCSCATKAGAEGV